MFKYGPNYQYGTTGNIVSALVRAAFGQIIYFRVGKVLQALRRQLMNVPGKFLSRGYPILESQTVLNHTV